MARSLIGLLVLSVVSTCSLAAEPAGGALQKISPYMSPPAEFAGQLGDYRSPLKFEDGRDVKTAADWAARRAELLAKWTALLGPWPPLVERPTVEVVGESKEDGYTRYKVNVQVAPKQTVAGYLLVPTGGKPPYPAVVVPFYEPETSVGLNTKRGQFKDYGVQLAKRGFVTLSIGSPGGDARQPDKGEAVCQPLSYLAYVSANCHTALAQRPDVDPARIGIVGHSYGGKWSMFSAALYDKFAACVTSDPGIVFDEKRSNVNYWEKWYLGLDPTLPEQRKPGSMQANPVRTGPYKTMVERGIDLHELHALIAPRPFLVSGGAEDPPSRWVPLNHAVAVNKVLGVEGRVGMTNRKEHNPDAAANEVVYAFFEHFLKDRAGK